MSSRLSPERRLHLYLGIARKMRPLGPEARGVRHAAVEQAWQARRDLREARAEAFLSVLNAIYSDEQEE